MIVPHEIPSDTHDYSTSNKVEILDNRFAYVEYILDAVRNLDIKNFNFVIFEEDIDNMSILEFDIYYNDIFINKIIPAMQNYLNIDISYFDDQSSVNKRGVIKSIVKFYTTFLPYNYLKQFISSKATENKYDALELIDSNIRQVLADCILNSKTEYNNFLKLMTNVKANLSTDKKKDKFDSMLNILDSNIGDKVKMNDYFGSIIQTSSSDSLIDLCKLYIKNDYENIA